MIYPRRSSGWAFSCECEWVGLNSQSAGFGTNLVFVFRAGREIGDEYFPDPGVAEHPHHVEAAVPAIEIADNTDAIRIRRPHCERCPLYAFELANVSAQLFPDPFVFLLGP